MEPQNASYELPDAMPPLAATHAHQLYPKLDDLLAFRAPYLEEKLLNLRLTANREQAKQLFDEVKRYLALVPMFPDRRVPMVSTRVDEVWHQFALFTNAYARFCERFFGGMLHHWPREGTELLEGRHEGKRIVSFHELYAEAYGPVPDLWTDELWVSANTCLRVEREHTLTVRLTHDRAVLVDTAAQDVELCRVSKRAAAALSFIATTPKFFVRELPELRSHDERVQVCRPLVRLHVCKVAS